MSDKLLTLRETAESLGLSEDEVRYLVKKGRIPAYQVGGVFLRFKEEQILSLKQEHAKRQSEGLNEKPHAALEKREFFMPGLRDFFYFNDFYIISAIIVVCLLLIIYISIK